MVEHGLVAPGKARVWLLVLMLFGVAAALSVVIGTRASVAVATTLSPTILAVLVVAAFALAERASVHIRIGRHAFTLTLNEIPLVVGLFLCPPTVFIIARVVGALLPLTWRNRRSPHKLAFNIGLYWLEACVAVLVWHLLLGGAGTLGPRVWLAAGVSVVVTDVVGALLIAAAIKADGESPPRLRALLVAPESLAPLLNASAALVVLYVVSVDWRALWTVGVVVAVLFFAQRSYEGLRRRTESLEQLSRFTAQIGAQLDVGSAAQAAVGAMARVLGAATVELVLTEDFAGQLQRWVAHDNGEVAVVPGPGAAVFLAPWLRDGPLLVSRRVRDPALRRALADAGLRDAMAMPLQGDGEVIGTLLVGDGRSDVEAFGASDLRQMQAFGNHLSVTLRNARRADLITEHAAEQLRRSMHDELTDLPNRRYLARRLGEHRDGDCAVVLFDLDRFREINDTLGHRTGDALLRIVAERLCRSAPPDAVVARLAGDEFAVLLNGGDEVVTGAVVAMLRHTFTIPFDLDELHVTVEASVGVAVSEQGVRAVDLLRQADLAMHTAKSRRTGLERYRRELDPDGRQRLTLLTDLTEALSRGALTVHFQPKVRVCDGQILGAEALVRWVHPQRGYIPPDEFIPVAEHSGLITPLTFAVLGQSLAACASWRRAGWLIGVAVNISPRSLLDWSFVDEVARVLAATDVPAGSVTLEITETSLMAEPERAVEALHRLRSLGVRLSIDDLGTGYSSLAYLQRLPVSEVKIDQSFLRPGEADDDSLAIVGAIVDLGHRLGREVVAEGVEDEATWRTLQRLGCDSAQGYWMSPPMPGEKFLPWLDTWRAPAQLTVAAAS